MAALARIVFFLSVLNGGLPLGSFARKLWAHFAALLN